MRMDWYRLCVCNRIILRIYRIPHDTIDTINLSVRNPYVDMRNSRITHTSHTYHMYVWVDCNISMQWVDSVENSVK